MAEVVNKPQQLNMDLIFFAVKQTLHTDDVDHRPIKTVNSQSKANQTKLSRTNQAVPFNGHAGLLK